MPRTGADDEQVNADRHNGVVRPANYCKTHELFICN
jgi:hypothetical protein